MYQLSGLASRGNVTFVYNPLFEGATRQTLIDTYRDLANLARQHPSDTAAWRDHIRELVRTGTPEDRRMRLWLIGLAKKTADNLGKRVADYPSVFDEVMACIDATAASDTERRELALMLWCGTATLTIRGSQKSRIGKALERSIAGAALTSLGYKNRGASFG